MTVFILPREFYFVISLAYTMSITWVWLSSSGQSHINHLTLIHRFTQNPQRWYNFFILFSLNLLSVYDYIWSSVTFYLLLVKLSTVLNTNSELGLCLRILLCFWVIFHELIKYLIWHMHIYLCVLFLPISTITLSSRFLVQPFFIIQILYSYTSHNDCLHYLSKTVTHLKFPCIILKSIAKMNSWKQTDPISLQLCQPPQLYYPQV